MPKKNSSKKLYFAIILIVIIAVSAGAVIYITQFSNVPIKVGVHVGDTFTYKLTGVSNLTSPDAVTSQRAVLRWLVSRTEKRTRLPSGANRRSNGIPVAWANSRDSEPSGLHR